MSIMRNKFISFGAPLVVAIGLGLVWAGRGAGRLKAQIEAWADSLEHSPNPVTLNLSVLPLYVDGSRVGKLTTVVVQRHEPGAVDSLRLVVEVGDRGLGNVADCDFRLDPDAFDRSGPLGFKRVMRCVRDTDGLVLFGSVEFTDVGHVASLYLDASDLPCRHMSGGGFESCREIGEEIRRLRDEIGHNRHNVRVEVRAARREIERAREEVARVRAKTRTTTEGNR